MLVLTRKQQQKITVGDHITITVLRIKGNTVRLGVEAPDGVRILRSELAERDCQREAAAETAAPLAFALRRKHAAASVTEAAEPTEEGVEAEFMVENRSTAIGSNWADESSRALELAAVQ